MFDALLSALPPQTSKLVKPTRVAPPTVEQVVVQRSKKPLSNLAVSPPESLPPELSAKQKAGLIDRMKAKAAGTPTQPPAAADTQPQPNPTATPNASAEQPKESASPSPGVTAQKDAKQQAFETSKAERLKLLEQKLAEIVEREKPIKEEKLRQNLRAIAIRQAEAGQLEQARQTAKDLVLSPAEQTELKTKIDALAKRTATKKPELKQPLQVTQLKSPGLQSAPTYPSYVMPGAVLGSNIRLSQLGWKLSNGDLSLAFPLPFPVPMLSGFGWRTHPITGDRRFHQGIDLGAAYGTPVIAAFSGKVEIADWMGGYGIAVVLTHKNSTQTLYAHLSELFVKPGQWVEQGTLIGRVGSTGLSTGPHLHFELHQLTDAGWVVVDPAIQLEVAETRLAQAMQTGGQNPLQPFSLNLPQSYAAIPPPPTQKFDFLHNY